MTERFDAGIRIGERVERDMIAVRVSEPVQSAIAASPAYLARRPAPRRPSDLAQHDCIRVRFASGGLLPWTLLQDGAAAEVAVDGSLICNDEALALRAALTGSGCCGPCAPWSPRSSKPGGWSSFCRSTP